MRPARAAGARVLSDEVLLRGAWKAAARTYGTAHYGITGDLMRSASLSCCCILPCFAVLLLRSVWTLRALCCVLHRCGVNLLRSALHLGILLGSASNL